MIVRGINAMKSPAMTRKWLVIAPRMGYSFTIVEIIDSEVPEKS